jgi:hypothetical protein
VEYCCNGGVVLGVRGDRGDDPCCSAAGPTSFLMGISWSRFLPSANVGLPLNIFVFNRSESASATYTVPYCYRDSAKVVLSAAS